MNSPHELALETFEEKKEEKELSLASIERSYDINVKWLNILEEPKWWEFKKRYVRYSLRIDLMIITNILNDTCRTINRYEKILASIHNAEYGPAIDALDEIIATLHYRYPLDDMDCDSFASSLVSEPISLREQLIELSKR